MFNAKAQRRKDAKRLNRRIESLLVWIYDLTLKLYPYAFQTAFADEMRDVFTMMLEEANGSVGLMLIMWHELYSLPVGLFGARMQTYRQLPLKLRRIQQARWFVRITGGLLSLFLLSTLRILVSPSYNLYAQAVPFVVALFVATISMLVGVRWERVGGLLSIASGAAIGCCMTLYLYVMAANSIGILATVVIGIIWALPFLIFGILFYELSKQPKPQLART